MDAEKTPVMNMADVPMFDFGHGDAFEARLGRIGRAIGSHGIGCMVTVVPAGKRAFPFHAHHANHELFLVLEGEGEYRLGDKIFPVKPMDVIAAPAGGPETAHQLINTGSTDMRYLAFSTMHDPDVVDYPDSGKFAVASGVDKDDPSACKRLLYFGRKANSLEYWDGED